MNNESIEINGQALKKYKLEIGKHSFRDRILDNCVYVDKTKYIYELTSNESNCFLSRPRRFGKSLLLSTIKEIFSGSRELFENCWIYDKIDWKKYNIIHLDFIRFDYMTLGLEEAIENALNRAAEEFNITLKSKSGKEKFDELIESLSKKEKVVILIDEYDKPIIDYTNNIAEAEKNRDILRNFYSILKSQSQNIKFLLITGVSKFTKVSIFSDLNHLKDITLHPGYSTMLGYTKEEIEHFFSYYIARWEKQTGEKAELLFEQLKDYYNGYSWDGMNFVYNPYSILNFFDTYDFHNYWFASGSPSFLINSLRGSQVFVDQYERMDVSENFFESFDIEKIDISVLLFQTGYLTIKEKKDKNYILTYPNREVKEAFLEYLLEGFTNKKEYETRSTISEIKDALEKNDVEQFIRSLKILLSSIPYNIQVENREAYYHSLIYIALKLSMMNVLCEIQTAKGRSDILVCTNGYIYIIELKMNSAQKALGQIIEKQYYFPHLGQTKEIILLGIGLSEKERNIHDWKTCIISKDGDTRSVEMFKASVPVEENGDLETLLGELSNEAKVLKILLKKEKADEMIEDMETFIKEAGKLHPRQEWLQLSSEGIKRAAQSVGDKGIPVIEKLDKILLILQ